jgi:hypothetical protein
MTNPSCMTAEQNDRYRRVSRIMTELGLSAEWSEALLDAMADQEKEKQTEAVSR